MTHQGSYPVNPYAGNRPAGARTFVGYRDGKPSVKDVCGCLTASGSGSGYWLAGEPRSGKSSFLLRIADLLRDDPGGQGRRFRPVPLYASCAKHRSPTALFQGLLQNLVDPAGPLRSAEAQTGELGPFQLLSIPAGAQRLLPLLWEDLAAAARVLYGNQSLFVLLIDDVDAAVEQRWDQKLFPTLKMLLTQPPTGGSRCGLTCENVKLVLAGSPDLAAVRQFDRVSGLLGNLKLKPLQLNDIKELILQAGKATLNGNLAERILRAAGGHPWLTQLVLEEFTNAKRPERDFAAWFKSFDWPRLSGDEEQQDGLKRWLARLPEGGSAILARLTLARDGMTSQELGDGAGGDESALAKLCDLGLVYPSVHRPEAYEICEIVKRCYLDRSGSAVLLGEIERLKTSAASPARAAARDFSLLLSLDHRVMVADGLYTRFFSLDNGFTEEARRLYRDARDAAAQGHLEDLRARLGNLGKNFVDEDWRVAWEDYFQQTDRRRIRFILQTGDLDLLDFPIELLPFEQGFLGLRAPAFKEIIGLRRKQPYRLAGGCLPASEPINVLLVGAGAGGQYEKRPVQPLPGVVQELAGIVAALRSAADRGSFSPGRIVVLCDTPDLFIEGADVMPATVDGLRLALGGEPKIGFHILHYSGHYQFGRADHLSGLLIPGAGGLELFSLPALFQQLDGGAGTVRFACFNGCRSGGHLPSSPTHYLGAPYTCLRAGVPAVIGMRWPIDDLEARDLGICFYQRLAAHGVPEVALLEARKWAETARGGTLWAAPVMLTC